MSAPERSSLAVMYSSRSKSLASVILLVWIWKILRRVFSSGSGNSIFLSMRPVNSNTWVGALNMGTSITVFKLTTVNPTNYSKYTHARMQAMELFWECVVQNWFRSIWYAFVMKSICNFIPDRNVDVCVIQIMVSLIWCALVYTLYISCAHVHFRAHYLFAYTVWCAFMACTWLQYSE